MFTIINNILTRVQSNLTKGRIRHLVRRLDSECIRPPLAVGRHSRPRLQANTAHGYTIQNWHSLQYNFLPLIIAVKARYNLGCDESTVES